MNQEEKMNQARELAVKKSQESFLREFPTARFTKTLKQCLNHASHFTENQILIDPIGQINTKLAVIGICPECYERISPIIELMHKNPSEAKKYTKENDENILLWKIARRLVSIGKIV